MAAPSRADGRAPDRVEDRHGRDGRRLVPADHAREAVLPRAVGAPQLPVGFGPQVAEWRDRLASFPATPEPGSLVVFVEPERVPVVNRTGWPSGIDEFVVQPLLDAFR